MSNMINVQEIRRNVINVVKNYSDAQVKVRKATSNEPWGPSSTLMSEIADLTYNVVAFSEIMQIVWKRLNDHGKNWRHVYKALVLLEYLIKAGSEKVAQQCRDNLFTIQTLKDFQHFEDNKDHGLSVREKSKILVNLLKDEEKLKIERARALKAKERFAQSLSCTTSMDGESMKPSTSSSYHESLSSSSDNPGSSRNLNPELENARPQTAGEEELQLQLALAMSKEEAEQEERLRKNDDLRLKLALQESEKNSPKSAAPKSAVDELLSLQPPSMMISADHSSVVTTDPWGTPLNNTAAPLLSSPPSALKANNSDPWGAPRPVVSNFEKNSFEDPWSSNSRPTSANNDPWGLNTSPSVNSDPWNASPSNETRKQSIDLADLMSAPLKKVDDTTRRTPESFLGANSNLVNLDALVSSKSQTSTSPNSNPFASTTSPASNPFQANKPSQPTINQLRAQTNQLGSTPPMGYSSTLNSLFSVPPGNTSPLPANFGSIPSTGLQTNGGSAWASFPASQNNPFAM